MHAGSFPGFLFGYFKKIHYLCIVMDIRGQWNKLNKYQQWDLIYLACAKRWKQYWGTKKKYLLENEKGEN